jgi:hypothetical protein
MPIPRCALTCRLLPGSLVRRLRATHHHYHPLREQVNAPEGSWVIFRSSDLPGNLTLVEASYNYLLTCFLSSQTTIDSG